MIEPALTQTYELVHRAKDGDREALDRLFDRYYEPVLRAVRASIGSKLRARLESVDVVQVALMKAFQGFERFELRSEGGFRHWVATVAECTVRDLGEHHSRKMRTTDREVGLETPSNGDSDDSRAIEIEDEAVARPDLQASISEEHQQLERALDQLSEPMRELVILREFHELSWAEVAERTGRASADAARVAFSKAEAKLALVMDRMRSSSSDDGL
ncbi:MAG: sigma-70 family RNA polymerase sigma factor [Planctomycetota bacterium]